MPIVSVSEASDGDVAQVANVNSPVNAILAVVNGHLDQDNLADSGVTNAKLAGGITVDKLASNALSGWAPLGHNPNTIAATGNRYYTLTFSALDLTNTLSNGMRLQLTRTVPSPTKVASLNGTTQYFSKSTPSGMTFTDEFAASAWVNLSSYAAGTIASRYNGTSGWVFSLDSTGHVVLAGYNGGAANFSKVTSTAAIPLNQWVHVAAQLNMLTFTATTSTSFTMFNGLDTPAAVARGGTNPTALIQAGNLEIGSQHGGLVPLNAKIAQVAIYSADVTQATLGSSMNQTLSGSETSLVSAYSFNNSIADLNANANNLTANGSAVATYADSPFGLGLSATLEYATITAIAFSTDTVITALSPVGSEIPTSGGISLTSFSTVAYPHGFPVSTITTSDIQDSAVSTAKLQDDAVTPAKMLGVDLLGRGVALVGGSPPTAGSGQFYMQAGTFVQTTNVSGDGTQSFPTAFPNGLLTVILSYGDTTGGTAIEGLVGSSSKSLFSYHTNAPNTTIRVNYIALGW